MCDYFYPSVIVLKPVTATNYCHLKVALSTAAAEVELAAAAAAATAAPCSCYTPQHLQVLEWGGQKRSLRD